jgi:hypothetical protein
MHAPKGMGVVDQTCLHMGFTWAKGREGGGAVESNQENCHKGWPHNHQPDKLQPSSPPPPREATTAAMRQLGQVCMWFIYTIGDS